MAVSNSSGFSQSFSFFFSLIPLNQASTIKMVSGCSLWLLAYSLSWNSLHESRVKTGCPRLSGSLALLRSVFLTELLVVSGRVMKVRPFFLRPRFRVNGHRAIHLSSGGLVDQSCFLTTPIPLSHDLSDWNEAILHFWYRLLSSTYIFFMENFSS